MSSGVAMRLSVLSLSDVAGRTFVNGDLVQRQDFCSRPHPPFSRGGREEDQGGKSVLSCKTASHRKLSPTGEKRQVSEDVADEVPVAYPS
jgi:hypothetical protein